MEDNLYKILDLDLYSDIDEIKQSYRSLSKKYHPDTVTGDKEMFEKINYAYDILKNKKLKQQYDNTLQDGELHTHLFSDTFYQPSEEDYIGLKEENLIYGKEAYTHNNFVELSKEELEEQQKKFNIESKLMDERHKKIDDFIITEKMSKLSFEDLKKQRDAELENIYTNMSDTCEMYKDPFGNNDIESILWETDNKCFTKNNSIEDILEESKNFELFRDQELLDDKTIKTVDKSYFILEDYEDEYKDNLIQD